MKNASKNRDTVTKRHGGCRANHWEPGGAALGIPPLQELKKKTGQRVKLRSPYRKGRRPANSVCSILYVRGGAGTELGPVTPSNEASGSIDVDWESCRHSIVDSALISGLSRGGLSRGGLGGGGGFSDCTCPHQTVSPSMHAIIDSRI